MLFTDVSEDSSIERNLEYTNNPHWSVADADVSVVQIGPSSVCALYPFTQSLIQAKAYLPFSPKLKLSASFATSSIVGWNSAFASAGSLSKASFNSVAYLSSVNIYKKFLPTISESISMNSGCVSLRTKSQQFVNFLEPVELYINTLFSVCNGRKPL